MSLTVPLLHKLGLTGAPSRTLPHERTATSARVPAARSGGHCILLCTGALVLLSACSQSQMKRATYQALRQGDCQLNGFDEYCRRNFNAEYHQYQQLRNDFLHERRYEQQREPASDPLAALPQAAS